MSKNNKESETHNETVGRDAPLEPLELWGGIECSVVRVGDAYSDQFLTGDHHSRADADLERIAELGIRTLRYPVSWERIAPEGDLARADWSWIDACLTTLRRLGITPIAGLLHHGGGPPHTSLIDPEFPEKLAAFARAAAERYPWITDWTPVNEPLTTARFSGLYGHWYPHGHDEATFARCLLNEIKGTVLALREIRRVHPQARLVQTEDLGKTYSTPTLAYQADFENERRWVSFDLLEGRVAPESRMGHHLRWAGISPRELEWFQENPCPPAVVGINHYLTSERFLDERLDRYPAETHGGNGTHRYADLEAVRVLQNGCAGAGTLLTKAWERYGHAVALTEVHLGCTREDQMRWMAEVWNEARQVRERCGVGVQAVTAWSLFGAWDWDSLLTQRRNSYEPGVFDVRGKAEGGTVCAPRATALAAVCRALTETGEAPDLPVLDSPGWWRRPDRLLYPAYVAEPAAAAEQNELPVPASAKDKAHQRPLLITGGKYGLLANALAYACRERGLAYRLVGRDECDISSASAVEKMLDDVRPWAVLNAAGYTAVDLAESEMFACFRDNFKGPVVLARTCARHRLPLAVFSSAMVFDGGKAPEAYTEGDLPNPSGVYARSKAAMEHAVQTAHPSAFVIRCAALWGPWDGRNFLTRALQGLCLGQKVVAARDDYLTPAYLPDLTKAVLDLLIDGATGIWHLAHPLPASEAPLSRAGLIAHAAERAGISTKTLVPVPKATLRYGAGGPAHSGWAVLSSERTAPLLPPLSSALGHFALAGASHWQPNDIEAGAWEQQRQRQRQEIGQRVEAILASSLF